MLAGHAQDFDNECFWYVTRPLLALRFKVWDEKTCCLLFVLWEAAGPSSWRILSLPFAHCVCVSTEQQHNLNHITKISFTIILVDNQLFGGFTAVSFIKNQFPAPGQCSKQPNKNQTSRRKHQS